MKYELLAPVGNFSMLHSAIDAGADAVYLGLDEFTMRQGAKNFSIRNLAKIQTICKSKNVSVFLTLNAIVYDTEIKRMEDVIKKVKNKIDAIICWDPAVIGLCNKYEIPFHISTQASISNQKASEFYKKLGAQRVILARELSLKQIKKIAKNNFVECFAHGAMCVAISGRCFMSQFTHNSSANKGTCTHPCRRAWTITDNENNQLKLENSRVMSAKDLCTLPFIEKMKSAGIKSFKIEGRNRSSEYVSTVVRIYRRALDNKLSTKEILEGISELKKVYNRGFSSGFYIRPPTSDDFSFTENGEQEEYKQFTGRVEKYWQKAGSATVRIMAGNLKTGDEIYLISKGQAIKRVTISTMEIDGKPLNKCKKGELVGIKLPKCSKGTDVYLIKRKALIQER